jgi:hypothetical protein
METDTSQPTADAPLVSPTSPLGDDSEGDRISADSDVSDARDMKTFDELFNSDSEIQVWTGVDDRLEIRQKLELEFKQQPLRNVTFANDVEAQADPTHKISVIYITNFYVDNIDFCMYVKGRKNITSLVGGTFTQDRYDGPYFGTPVRLHDVDEVLFTRAVPFHTEKVSRRETKGKRFRYLYETAKLAWDRLEYDPERDSELRRNIGSDETRVDGAEEGDDVEDGARRDSAQDASGSRGPASHKHDGELPRSSPPALPGSPEDHKEE